MRFLIAIVVLLLVSLMTLWYAFTVPDSPQLVSIDSQQTLDTSLAEDKQSAIQKREVAANQPYCYRDEAAAKPIDQDGRLGLLVWNIYKQNEANWEQALDSYAKNAQLMMLQEASLTTEFKAWISKQSWGASYVSAFEVFDVGAGVLNLATQMPIEACAYTAVEPWILLPKSGLYALYQLSNGETLAVINVHAINFTIGTKEYLEQIEALESVVNQHQGPVIMAGDFNTWSEKRTGELKNLVQKLSLKEASFSPDNRRLFVNGLPLDHVFYRGMKLISGQSPTTDASDHNPLLVEFELTQ